MASSCSLFTDDCLLYRQIRSIDDCRILQDDLLGMEDWVNTWKMDFNIDKCEVLQISLSKIQHMQTIIYMIIHLGLLMKPNILVYYWIPSLVLINI